MWVAHVASMCAVSPGCPEHVHVILVPSSTTTGMTVHGGHLLSAQQPFEPLSVPSSHGPPRTARTARRSARRFIGGQLVEREKRRGVRVEREEDRDSEGVDEGERECDSSLNHCVKLGQPFWPSVTRSKAFGCVVCHV